PRSGGAPRRGGARRAGQGGAAGGRDRAHRRSRGRGLPERVGRRRRRPAVVRRRRGRSAPRAGAGPPVIVVYADGGGLGHLTRIQAVRHTLGLAGPMTVLTSSPHVDDQRVVDGLRVLAIPFRREDLAARRSWLQRTLVDLAPSLLVVDAFPAGLAGEL